MRTCPALQVSELGERMERMETDMATVLSLLRQTMATQQQPQEAACINTSEASSREPHQWHRGHAVEW
jgi:hypothetical protein